MDDIEIDMQRQMIVFRLQSDEGDVNLLLHCKGYHRVVSAKSDRGRYLSKAFISIR